MMNKKNWMSTISDKKKLINLNIPGTHDSGTFGTIVPFAKTQNWSIEEQLNNGIRFIDIRLSKISQDIKYKEFALSKVFILMHGIAPVGGDFVNDVLTPIYKFLNENPKETILMSIKSEESTLEITSDDMKGFADFDKSYDHVKSIKDVELGDVRGKIILINRVTNDHGYVWSNFKIQDDYELSMSYYQQITVPFSKERTKRICLPFTNICREQVTWPGTEERTKSIADGWDYDKKTDYISKFLKDYETNSNRKLNINFLTASSSSFQFYVPFTNGVEKNARIQNRYIERKNWDANGMIFPMDYPTNEAINKIISSNT